MHCKRGLLPYYISAEKRLQNLRSKVQKNTHGTNYQGIDWILFCINWSCKSCELLLGMFRRLMFTFVDQTTTYLCEKSISVTLSISVCQTRTIIVSLHVSFLFQTTGSISLRVQELKWLEWIERKLPPFFSLHYCIYWLSMPRQLFVPCLQYRCYDETI